MSFNCFKKVNGDHSIDVQSMEDLKSDLHMSHSKWQKYGLSLKKDVDYDAAIAKLSSASSDDYHYEDCDDGVKIVFHTQPKPQQKQKIFHQL
jgi:hypothetical protein